MCGLDRGDRGQRSCCDGHSPHLYAGGPLLERSRRGGHFSPQRGLDVGVTEILALVQKSLAGVGS